MLEANLNCVVHTQTRKSNAQAAPDTIDVLVANCCVTETLSMQAGPFTMEAATTLIRAFGLIAAAPCMQRAGTAQLRIKRT